MFMLLNDIYENTVEENKDIISIINESGFIGTAKRTNNIIKIESLKLRTFLLFHRIIDELLKLPNDIIIHIENYKINWCSDYEKKIYIRLRNHFKYMIFIPIDGIPIMHSLYYSEYYTPE